MHTYLFIIVISVFVLLVLLSALNKAFFSRHCSYRPKKYLLSKAERSFYGVLIQAVGGMGLVFSKVRVADVLEPVKGLGRSRWQQAFNRISSKHFDFILCDPGDCSVKLAIELDDASHNSVKSKKRDAFVNGACGSAGLPLLRVKAAKGYTVVDIRHKIETLTGVSGNRGEGAKGIEDGHRNKTTQKVVSESSSASFIKAASVDPQAYGGASLTPSCPKCGALMLRRKVKAGSRAGQTFWGCSNFPKCRAMKKIDN